MWQYIMWQFIILIALHAHTHTNACDARMSCCSSLQTVNNKIQNIFASWRQRGWGVRLWMWVCESFHTFAQPAGQGKEKERVREPLLAAICERRLKACSVYLLVAFVCGDCAVSADAVWLSLPLFNQSAHTTCCVLFKYLLRMRLSVWEAFFVRVCEILGTCLPKMSTKTKLFCWAPWQIYSIQYGAAYKIKNCYIY